MENFRSHPDRLALGLGSDRPDHEFLEGDWRVGMRSAVNNVHHRNRKNVGVGPADVAVERNVQGFGRRLRRRKGNAKNRVGSKLALCGSSVKGEHFHVQRALLKNVEAFERGGDDLVHVFHGLKNALSAVARLVAVAHFKRFVLSGARSAGNGGAAKNAVFQDNVHFNCGVSARVDYLAADDFVDCD